MCQHLKLKDQEISLVERSLGIPSIIFCYFSQHLHQNTLCHVLSYLGGVLAQNQNAYLVSLIQL